MADTETTHDALIGGAVSLEQPTKGFRAGTDSVLLGASVATEKMSGKALEFGCGPGGALFVAAHHLKSWSFTGVELDHDIAALAKENAKRNRCDDRVDIEVGELPKAVSKRENAFDLVFSNPPFFDPGTIVSPGEGKSDAYIQRTGLDDWLKGMLFAAKPRAPIVLIHRATELAKILTRLDKQAGDISVLPIRPYPEAAANRVIVRARKGLRSGSLSLLSGLDIYEAKGGAHTERAKAILMGAPLEWR